MCIDQNYERFHPLLDLFKMLLNKGKNEPTPTQQKKLKNNSLQTYNYKEERKSLNQHNSESRKKLLCELNIESDVYNPDKHYNPLNDKKGSFVNQTFVPSNLNSNKSNKRSLNSIQLKRNTKNKRIVVNVSMTRYPIVRKIARYEFSMFMSDKDMFNIN